MNRKATLSPFSSSFGFWGFFNFKLPLKPNWKFIPKCTEVTVSHKGASWKNRGDARFAPCSYPYIPCLITRSTCKYFTGYNMHLFLVLHTLQLVQEPGSNALQPTCKNSGSKWTTNLNWRRAEVTPHSCKKFSLHSMEYTTGTNWDVFCDI